MIRPTSSSPVGFFVYRWASSVTIPQYASPSVLIVLNCQGPLPSNTLISCAGDPTSFATGN